MSRKRPSVFDTLELTGGADEIPPTAPLAPAQSVEHTATPAAPSPAPTPVQKSKPRGKPEVHHTSIYVPKAAFRRIRDIANNEDRKPHDVIMQGIDLLFAKYGFPSLADYRKGRAR